MATINDLPNGVVVKIIDKLHGIDLAAVERQLVNWRHATTQLLQQHNIPVPDHTDEGNQLWRVLFRNCIVRTQISDTLSNPNPTWVRIVTPPHPVQPSDANTPLASATLDGLVALHAPYIRGVLILQQRHQSTTQRPPPSSPTHTRPPPRPPPPPVRALTTIPTHHRVSGLLVVSPHVVACIDGSSAVLCTRPTQPGGASTQGGAWITRRVELGLQDAQEGSTPRPMAVWDETLVVAEHVPHTKERRLHVVDMYGASHRAIYSLDHGAPIVGLVIPGQHGVDHPSDAHVDQLPWHVYFYGGTRSEHIRYGQDGVVMRRYCPRTQQWVEGKGGREETYPAREYLGWLQRRKLDVGSHVPVWPPTSAVLPGGLMLRYRSGHLVTSIARLPLPTVTARFRMPDDRIYRAHYSGRYVAKRQRVAWQMPAQPVQHPVGPLAQGEVAAQAVYEVERQAVPDAVVVTARGVVVVDGEAGVFVSFPPR